MTKLRKYTAAVFAAALAMVFLTGCTSGAVKAYEKGIEKMEEGDYKSAADYFDKVISKADNDSEETPILIDACYLKGECLALSGDSEGAEKAYDKALEEDNKERSYDVDRTSSTWLRRGLVYRDRGEYAEATKAFRQGLKVKGCKADQELRANLICSLESEGKYEEALVELTTYVAKYPEDSDMNREYNFLKSRFYN